MINPIALAGAGGWLVGSALSGMFFAAQPTNEANLFTGIVLLAVACAIGIAQAK